MSSKEGQTSSSKSDENIIGKTFKFLKMGEVMIRLENRYKDNILVIGETGNGKTCFTKWISGYDTQLVSRETIEDTGEYVIEDIHGNGNATITSDTVYPTLVIDAENNVSYYDCPGFNDSRSPSNDIATTYFIKKIVDHSNRVKILIVINYPSVRKGVERHNFMQLMKHASEFIKNDEKLQNSIALVVTKVDNIYIKRGTVLVEDTKVLATIVDFLQEVLLEVSASVINRNRIERRYYEAVKRFVSYFLKKEGEQYPNIGIFRRPDESGPVSEIPLLLKGKENIKRIIHRNLTFTEIDEHDFGYTISLKSRNVIGGLVEEINESVWRSVVHITEGITTHFRTLINDVRKAMKSLRKKDSSVDAQNLSIYLKKGYQGISNLINEVQRHRNPYSLAQNLKKIMTYFENINFEDDILNIENQGKYFDFLQIASQETLNTRSWNELLVRAAASMSDFWNELQEDIDELAPTIEKDILSFFGWISKYLQDQLDDKIKDVEIQEVPSKLSLYGDILMSMVKRCKTATSINECLSIIDDVTHDQSINMPKEAALKVSEIEGNFKYLQNFTEKNYFAFSSEWIHPLQNLVKHVDESKTWYSFLDSIYRIFSKYGMQRDKEKYNVANLEDWGKSKAKQGIFINKNNFQRFIQKISEFNFGDLQKIKNISLTETRQEELNQVLNLTLKEKIDFDNQESSASLEGDYIIISKIMKILPLSSDTLKFIRIYSSNTIFIDKDLTLPSLSIVIVAPKWEIIGDIKINLSGADGEVHSTDKAKDGSKEDPDGKQGKPGLPGKPGGSFFGMGESFVNGDYLTITTNGGDGSPGQHGGNGLTGKQGKHARLPTSVDSPQQQHIENRITSIGGFECEKIGGTDIHDGELFTEVLLSTLVHSSMAEYQIFGHPGGKGGNGGNGGKGGEGGNEGLIKIYNLNAKSGIVKQSKRGRRGTDGKGGEGGPGGCGGNHIIARCLMFRPAAVLSMLKVEETTTWKFHSQIDNYERREEDFGKPGAEGANSNGSLFPEPVKMISDSFEIVSMYKKYLLKNLTCRFKRLSLLSFLNKIDEAVDI